MSTDRRKVEIEAKRTKLAELRKAREARASALSSAVPSRSHSTLGGEIERPASSRAQLDDLVSNLLSDGVPLTPTRGQSPALGLSAGRGSAQSGTASVASEGEIPLVLSPEPGALPNTVETQTDTRPTDTTATVVSPPLPPVPIVPPKVYYDKSIQTSFELYPVVEPSSTDPNGAGGGAGKETADDMRARITAELEDERRKLDREIEEEKAHAAREIEQLRLGGLDAPALSSVLASPPFLDFLSSSSKIVQRALSDSYDYLRDYTVTANEDGVDTDKSKVRLLGSWYEDKWGRGRSVTGVDWSPKFPELFVASYNKSRMDVNEPEGIVAVWNLHLLERPEFVFHAQSDVLSVAFTPFNPNLVIGGTYSGQILLWDTRSRHPNPVLKTSLSSSGHTHPVYSLSLVGTQNAHNLISASTDGTVCAWSIDMLAKPQETLELLHTAQSNKTDEVSITALSFAEGETTTFWVGTEEGNVYSANRTARAGAKEGLVQNEIYKGHSGPVTGMDFHPVAGALDLSDLFLTCGVDWTVKLWRDAGSAATGKGSLATNGPGGKLHKPIMSFEDASDYVYDVKWHPHHPALFGSVDGAGKFDLWNLNIDQEVPIVSTAVGGTPARGLNKLAWERKEGRRAAIGSLDGKVYVYEISEELVQPKEGDWSAMRATCNAVGEGGR